MKKITRWVGLDVHAETITAAIAERGEVRSLGSIANRPEAVRKLLKKLGERDEIAVCYEAGPTGYVLYWQITKLGIRCEVIAPTLIPRRPGDKVKTDRRDAEQLARCYRAGDLTPVWVPDKGHEALRDLVRCREGAKADQLRARHRLSKLLLRQGVRPATGIKAWTRAYHNWLKTVRFEEAALEAVRIDLLAQVHHQAARVEQLEKAIDEAIAQAPEQIRAVVEGLQAMRGIRKLTAVTVVAELGKLSRFASARRLMGYAGVVPKEYSSGSRVSRGSITKSGNAHLRRVIGESAWTYRHPPALYPTLKKRQVGVSDEVKAIAWKAQHRLYSRYRRLTGRGKNHNQVTTAVARELLGFIWSIATTIERAAG